jgi:glucose-6-phosphate 1-dehydrogenase
LETENNRAMGNERSAGDAGDPCAMIIFGGSRPEMSTEQFRQMYRMAFNYTDYFNATPQTGYERLLYDCMLGDATLFQRSDMVEAAWHVVAPIQNVWGALDPREFPNYVSGTCGPAEADELLVKDGRHWYNSPAIRESVDTKTATA